MSLSNWLFYVATILTMMSTPGPSQLLMISHSISNGFPRSIATAVGDLSANSCQMLVASTGISAIIIANSNALSAIQWIGVCYLIFNGYLMIKRGRASLKQGNGGEEPLLSKKQMWVQGFITSASNPKAIIFFAALFPQFIDTELPFLQQFIVLSLTYLCIDGLFLIFYGLVSARIAKRFFTGENKLNLNVVSGILMLFIALLLAVKTLYPSVVS